MEKRRSMQPQDHYFKGLSSTGFHKVKYTEWGDPGNPRVLVCVHGLSRNGRDFDYLAEDLAHEYRVICPDMPGRGLSDWLQDPHHYAYPQYLSDLTALIARLQVDTVDWIGTSMGGILGMLIAAQSGTPIKRLIINDVGAFIPAGSLKRIVQYVSTPPVFPSREQAKTYLKRVLASFGIHEETHWEHLVRHSIVEIENHQFRLHHDPKIVSHFPTEDVNLWNCWQKIECPVLLIRGKDSDVLPQAIATKMAQRKGTTLMEIEGAGHAPSLMASEQIDLVTQWLRLTSYQEILPAAG
jgi:pimeloyl-ACP methyl ester carboxylesterase